MTTQPIQIESGLFRDYAPGPTVAVDLQTAIQNADSLAAAADTSAAAAAVSASNAATSAAAAASAASTAVTQVGTAVVAAQGTISASVASAVSSISSSTAAAATSASNAATSATNAASSAAAAAGSATAAAGSATAAGVSATNAASSASAAASSATAAATSVASATTQANNAASSASAAASAAASIVQQWNAGTISAIGTGITVSAGTISAPSPAAQWNAGTVASLGSGLSLSSGTLAATAPPVQWNAGTVAAIGSGLTLAAGTLTSGGSSSSPFPVTAAGTTQPVGQFTVSGVNAGVAIVPNNNGAIMLSIPDGTATGGNARGNNAIDLQMIRSGAAQVASGPGAIVIGEYNAAVNSSSTAIGYQNTTSAQNGFAAGAQNTINSGATDGYAIGQANTISGYGAGGLGVGNSASGNYSLVVGNSGNDRGNSSGLIFSGPGGRAQVESYVFQGYTSGSGALRLTTDGGGAGSTNVAALAASTSHAFQVTLVVNDRGNGGAVYTMGPGVIGRGGGSVAMGASNPAFVLKSTWGTATNVTFSTLPTITADTSNNGYNLTITPNSGNTALLVCTARLDAVMSY